MINVIVIVALILVCCYHIYYWREVSKQSKRIIEIFENINKGNIVDITYGTSPLEKSIKNFIDEQLVRVEQMKGISDKYLKLIW